MPLATEVVSDKLRAMGLSDSSLVHIARKVQLTIYTELASSRVLDEVAIQAATDGANEAARIVKLVLEES